MSFLSTIAGLNSVALATFAKTVTLAGQPVSAVVEDAANPDESPDAHFLVMWMRYSDLPGASNAAGGQNGDLVVIDQVNYLVTDLRAEQDGAGIRMALQRQ